MTLGQTHAAQAGRTGPPPRPGGRAAGRDAGAAAERALLRALSVHPFLLGSPCLGAP